ncbi:MAG: DoxX family protein [Mesorhizobium sp.]|nr:DoxX family protein [Mesorhizobium sp.]
MSLPASASSTASRWKPIAFWALKIVFAVAFFGAAAMKLYGPPPMVAEFDAVGLGQWFRYFTAILEIGGAILLLVPRTTFFGAALLTVVCVGAFFAQILALHQDWIHTVVMAAILAAIAWSQRGQVQLS